MELIVISESKLKIMMTASDMAHYELENVCLDCADSHIRAAFRHIFDDARDRIGFETEGERLFIQFYASKEGGCEIFVTKLGDTEPSFPAYSTAAEPDFVEDDSPLLAVAAGEMTEGERELLRRVYEGRTPHHGSGCSPSPADNCTPSCTEKREEGLDVMETTHTEQRLSTANVRTATLIFSETRDLLTVCHRLLREGYRGRSTAYIEDRLGESLWYLLLDVPDVTLYRLPRRFAFLSEYGWEADTAGLPLYLSEYGRCICDGNAVEVLGRL